MTARVLQLLLAPAIGGAETLARGLQDGLPSRGLMCGLEFLDPTGCSSASFARLRRLRRLIRRHQPDLILAHSALPNLYARVAASRRIPVIVVLHSASRDFDDAILCRAERVLQARTAAVVAVAQPQVEEYEAGFGRGVRLELIPNGVSLTWARKWPRTDGPVRVVTLARVNRQKDPETWRGAALLALAARPDLAFAWSGPASEDPDLQALVADPVHASVTWAGPTHDAGGVLASADVYFHAARAEAHPLAPLEAATVGVPIVCSDLVAATLPAGLPAAVFVAGDPASAAAALLRVADDLQTATLHAGAWQARVRTEYGIDRVLSDYARLLRSVIPAERQPGESLEMAEGWAGR